jgi:LAO/AO transport system kinase
VRKAEQLVQGVLQGNRRSIAKTITLIENNEPEAPKIVSVLYQQTGKAHVIGVTGPTGSGKSTLIEKLIRELRRRGKTVGVVAVDPTSPFTGGAFLGDRVRMQEHSTDEGVFIRSMANRNATGGLAKATKDAVRVLDASGKDIVIVETVGAGQSEVEIVKVSHTVIVVLAPGLGDDIQAIKAGIMEIADIFVVNKADRQNADKSLSEIQAMLEMNTEKKGWKPSVLKTTALTGEGITELLARIEEHKEYLKKGALEASRKDQVETELVEAIKQKIAESMIEDLKRKGEWERLKQKILAKETDLYSVADRLLRKLRRN